MFVVHAWILLLAVQIPRTGSAYYKALAAWIPEGE